MWSHTTFAARLATGRAALWGRQGQEQAVLAFRVRHAPAEENRVAVIGPRFDDRARAYAEEWTLHDQVARFGAGAWAYLDSAAGERTVAMVSEPANRFLVPAMGPRYERRVTYVNVQAPDSRFAPDYPHCVPPRANPDRNAWLQNLVAARIHYLLVTVDPGRQAPIEATWAMESPELFVLRHRDETSAVWELSGPLAAAVEAASAAQPPAAAK